MPWLLPPRSLPASPRGRRSPPGAAPAGRTGGQARAAVGGRAGSAAPPRPGAAGSPSLLPCFPPSFPACPRLARPPAGRGAGPGRAHLFPQRRSDWPPGYLPGCGSAPSLARRRAGAAAGRGRGEPEVAAWRAAPPRRERQQRRRLRGGPSARLGLALPAPRLHRSCLYLHRVILPSAPPRWSRIWSAVSSTVQESPGASPAAGNKDDEGL